MFNIYSVQYVGTRRKITFREGNINIFYECIRRHTMNEVYMDGGVCIQTLYICIKVMSNVNNAYIIINENYVYIKRLD